MHSRNAANNTGPTDSFGTWIERRRKALDLTRVELAQQVGCALETIKKIERDERRPSQQIAELLARILEVPPGERERFLRAARGERSVDGLTMDRGLNQSAPGTLHNLLTETTPFVGREKELSEIARLIADPGFRLLTLVGPGGIGKSRVAFQAVRKEVGRFRNGVYQVSLAGANSPDHLSTSIANAYGLDFRGSADPRSLLLDDLHQKKILLLLDNFEHLLEGTELVAEILQNASEVKLLVTSRQRLNLQSEWLYQLEGLPFPERDDEPEVEQYSSVTLFVQTARRVRINFALDAVRRPWVARICRRVEGLPLAIELAASWTGVLTCQEIAAEIEQGISILAITARDVPEQHRNMRAVFDYSWERLSEQERSALRKLSVFRGGFTREAASQVAGASLVTLSALVDQSLLRVESRPGETQRFDLHALVRQYAFERLLETAEANQSHEDHLEYLLRLVEESALHLRQSEQAPWLKRVENEIDNLRAALDWALEGGQAETGLRLASVTWPFWNELGYLHEGRAWLDKALQKSQPITSPSRAKAYYGAGVLAWAEGDYPQAEANLEECLAGYRALGDQQGIAKALKYLGIVALYESDHRRAVQHFEASLLLFQALQDDWGIATTLVSLGVAAQERGEYAIACTRLEEGLALHQSRGDAAGAGLALINLGWTVLNLGDIARAADIFEKSLVHHRMMRDRWSVALSLNNLGLIALHQGNLAQAILLLEESLELFRDLEDRLNMLQTLSRLGYAALAKGEHQTSAAYLKQGQGIIHQVENKKFQAGWLEAWAALYSQRGQAEPGADLTAVALFGTASALRDQAGTPLPPIERADLEQGLSATRNRLGEVAFKQAWESGRTMTLQQAIAYALEGSGSQ